MSRHIELFFWILLAISVAWLFDVMATASFENLKFYNNKTLVCVESKLQGFNLPTKMTCYIVGGEYK